MVNKLITFLNKIYGYLNYHFFNKKIFCQKQIKKRKSKYCNHNISIFTNNCLGGVIYHDLGLEFQTPMINCFINWEIFPKLVLNVHDFLNADLIEHLDSVKKYPVGKLIVNGEVFYVNFNHDKDFNNAKKKWEERKLRVNYNKIVVIIDTFGKKLQPDFIKNCQELKKIYNVLCFYSSKVNGNLEDDLFVPLKKYDSLFYNSAKLCMYKWFSGKRIYEEYDVINYLNKIV